MNIEVANSREKGSQIDHIEALRLQILNEKAEHIAGHAVYGPKSDERVRRRDGLLRSLNLERDVRKTLYEEKLESRDEDNPEEHSDDWFSYKTLLHDDMLVRSKHEDMFVSDDKEGKIPSFDPKLTRTFLREQVAEGRIALREGRSLDDIDLQSRESEYMFRFPKSEYEREKGAVEQEKKKLKLESLPSLLSSREEIAEYSAIPGYKWFSALNMVDNFNVRAERSNYYGEMGLFLSLSSALAFLREKADEGLLEKKEMYNSLTEQIDTFFRQTPLKR